jgi:iron complex transport system substrate-binding protein
VGRKIQAPSKAVRIVTLAPSLGELAADILGTDLDRIVGVSEYSDQPAALKRLPAVGPFNQVSLEKVASLKPDLVLATADGNSKDQIARLTEMGIPVVVVSTQTLEEVGESMRLVGRALGLESQGNDMATQFLLGVSRIRERAKSRTISPRVLIQVGDDPLVVAGAGSFVSQSLVAIGARNLYGEAGPSYPRPALEDVVRRNPDSILILTMGTDEAPYRKSAEKWGTLKRLAAVREGKVRIVKGDSIVRPTLRLLEGMALLEKAVFGDKQATQAHFRSRKDR